MSSANDTPPVEYRPAYGFPLYRVGDDGSVWSRIGVGARNREATDEWKRLVGSTLPRGYQSYLLRESLLGRRCNRKGHTLVLEAFVCPRPDGMLCRHLDGNPANNRLSNLCWGTIHENAADSIKHGTQRRGSGQFLAKLTEADIPVIRQLIADGMPGSRIARKYGVTNRVIYLIADRKNWTHV